MPSCPDVLNRHVCFLTGSAIKGGEGEDGQRARGAEESNRCKSPPCELYMTLKLILPFPGLTFGGLLSGCRSW